MFVNPSSAFVGMPSRRRELLGQREERPIGEVVAVDEEELRLARGPVVQLQLDAGERLRHVATLCRAVDPLARPGLRGDLTPARGRGRRS